MTVERFAVSFDRELARAVRRSAAGEPTSAWLADAARRKLRSEGLLALVSEWESRHGEITEDELRAAELRMIRALRSKRRARKRR
jgi:hypothetical protein